ncbi:MAG: hypothetical protein ACFB50_06015 [Rubrobacteraceae bacterium]
MAGGHRLSFRGMLWMVPFATIVHNAEEYPAFVDYANRHGWRVSRPQMFAVVVAVSVLPFPVVAAATRSPNRSPGLVLGLAINVPLALYLYRRAAREGHLSTRQLKWAAVLGTGSLFPVLLAAQLAGRLVEVCDKKNRKGA